MRHLAVLALALVPTFAQAADQLGTITATIDGKEMSWFLTAEAGESHSRASPIPGIPAYSISLWGNPEDTALVTLKGGFILQFMAVTTGNLAMDPEIQYLENGYAGFWIALEDGVTQFSLDRLDATDDTITVSGSFTAEALYTEDSQTLATVAGRQSSLSGHFEATLPLD